MNTEIQIRPATKADVSTLVALGSQTFYDAFAAQNSEADMQQYLTATFTEEKIKAELEDPNAHFLLAFFQNEPVGYAKISYTQNPKLPLQKPALEIERLYISSAFQNQKTGATLMETCLKIARENGVKTMWLGVWEHNVKAQKFYSRFEFDVFDKHIFMLGTDAQTDLLMKLEL